jgi:hypothetical protein
MLVDLLWEKNSRKQMLEDSFVVEIKLSPVPPVLNLAVGQKRRKEHLSNTLHHLQFESSLKEMKKNLNTKQNETDIESIFTNFKIFYNEKN